MVKKSAKKAAPGPATKATKPTKKAAAPIVAKPSKKATKQESESESANSDNEDKEQSSDDEAQEGNRGEGASSGASRTMEEKLQDMNSKPSTSHSTGSTAHAAALSSTSSRTPTSTTPTIKHTTPKAADLQQSFLHALHTSDAGLLDACLLFTTPIAPIRETVRRIATIYVTPLLKSILEKFQQKPNQNAHLIEWIKTILLIHSNFLMSNPEIVQKLSNFYEAVDARVPVYRKVMNLSGRLDLIMNQIEMRKLYESQENGEEEAVYVEDEEQVEEEDLDHTGGMDDDEDDDDLVGEADAFDEDEVRSLVL
jgi:hypothetical protein